MRVGEQTAVEEALGRRLLSRAGFAAAIGTALTEESGFAAGKLGGSERAWLSYPEVLEREAGEGPRLRAYELALGHRSLRHAGIWPIDPAFLRRFSDRIVADLGHLDAIGVFSDALAIECELIRRHRPPGALMRFEDQEPIREPESAADQCWLEHLRGRRVLLVCPFAGLLRDRARREVYEPVWAATGKRWFEPAAVEGLELPYGFEPETQRRYGSALELLGEVAARMDGVEFDCALIAAGGLGIPLAVHAKRRGAVAISLGGHLQVMFGVHGERWLRRPEWRDHILNDSWVGVPDRYRPDPALTGEDYW